MKPGLPVRIVAAAVVLVAALVGLVIREGSARAQGQEVVLAIEAYDPRSPLGGHYVAFQLQDAAAACPPGVRDYGAGPAPKWVALTRDGPRHRVSGAAATRAQAMALGQVVVRGRAYCVQPPGGPRVNLEVGVDRFHADQQEAQSIERALAGNRQNASAFAVISAGRDGKARLKGIIVNGRRTDLTWL
ncbi:GDYXXLXY domain-containing protein [Phenylobacterium sp.]|uniref:GDYXXLXY domain-containing protein n=1 Tax=Phenylobacterium sp. TaxID=1871053 RepID=UPI002C61390A|nr:GDYXXLXY domain-containing protein [Phenylobacterium sp.]HVI33119.1 GDYXXLXY domain-containing protein [Phenylobacterium sp.]